MTTDQLFDAFSEQIMQVHFDAAKQGIKSPDIRSVMTHEARRVFLQAEMFRHMTEFGIKHAMDHDFEFRGSKVSLIPGSDIYFATRCTNLPPQ